MCVFCGGTCGGAGDALLPTLVASTSLLVMRLRLLRSKALTGDEEENPSEVNEESGSDETAAPGPEG
jgi:hypothetical protein